MKDFMIRVLRSNWYYVIVAGAALAYLILIYGIVRVVITGRPWPFG
jgi:hypothetical protein